ncbi:hypothetical protein Ndes2437B_g07974 [Nannochloris sp. 'desiccata']
MACTFCPLGSARPLMACAATNNRLSLGTKVPSKLGNTVFGNSASFRNVLAGNARRSARIAASAKTSIVCSAVENPFKYPREMTGLQGPLSSLPGVGVYVLGAALVVVLGGGASGAVGSLVPESLRTAGKTVGALVGAAVGGYVTLKFKEIRQSAAIIELINILVAMGDPTALTREQVVAVETKYGASLTTTCLEDLKSLYGTFVEAAIPAGDTPLTGGEAVLIQNFKAALGLNDADAAPVHIDVGRRVLRGRMESSNRGEDFEARKTFQKLIYVSSLVFGERQAAFLLPWVRVFNLNAAQLEVARRDNARALFKSRVESLGGLRAERAALATLKTYQSEIRLADDEATSVIVEAVQSTLQNCMDRAIECVKRRSRVRDLSEAVSAIREAIDFNRSLAALKGEEDVPAGIGAATLAGTSWESVEGRSKDLREIFRMYLEECLARDNEYTDALEADAADLRTIAGLGPKEASTIENEVKEKAYRKLLRDEVTSGRLDSAPSKAEVLGDLVDKVRWDGDAAMELHRTLYRQKLSTLLEKKTLTEEDDAELARLQRLLCVTMEDRNAMHKELCGSLFKEVVSAAMAGGIEGFNFEDRVNVKKGFESLRLERQIAKEIVEEVGRKYLMQFITTSKTQRDRISAAKELKKMVFFSNIVLSPLVEDLKTDEDKKKEAEEAAQQKEIQELMAKAREEAAKEKAKEESGETEEVKEEKEEAKGFFEAQEEARSAATTTAAAAAAADDKEEGEASDSAQPKSLEKAQAAAAARSDGERVGESATVMKSQKDITLGNDLELRDRVDIYRSFLLYCMTGDVMQGPMGVQMVTERDEGEFARLAQLGDVLGLSQMDVYGVHQSLAEQAFKSQVQNIMGDGMLTPDRAASLESVRNQMGLPKENADKIIKGLQNQKLISSMQAAKAQGSLSLEKVLELKEAGVEPSSVMTGDGLAQLYRAEISARLTDGTGDFDAEKLLNTLPADLGLESSKATAVVKELAGERKRTTLVQAVSFLRQKKVADTVKSLNNLRACSAALPESTTEAWGEKDEVADLYSLYCSKESDEARRAGVQSALGLSDEEASNLKSIVDSGGFKMGQEAEEEAASFF